VLFRSGLEPFATTLNRFGFAGLTEAADFHGYALALGGLDVRLEELVNAYRALANGGLLAPLRFTPANPAASPRRVLGRESAFLVADILSDRQARAPSFGLENPLATRFWTAVKTGTSKDMRDNWCVGFSSRYTVGVWVGNFSGASMHDVSGISGAAPAWAAIMAKLHADEASLPPAPTAGLLRRKVQPPGETTRSEWFLPGSEPADAAWAAATPPALILQPSQGAILALDPDIPAERQRLGFRANHLPEGAFWMMDGDRHAGDELRLARGRHRLQLVAPGGNVLDAVDFEVR
jgi:penicillin-binding protein 1C